MDTQQRWRQGLRTPFDVQRLTSFVFHLEPALQVRTQTLVKNAIIQVDSAPFKQWYQQHYNVELGTKKGGEEAPSVDEKKVRRADGRLLTC